MEKKAIVVSIAIAIISMAILCLVSPVIREAQSFPTVPIIAAAIYGIFMGVGTYCAYIYIKEHFYS